MTGQFRDPSFIKTHIEQLTQFYQQHAIDPQGGYYQTLLPTGEHKQPQVKQLVSSTRLTWVFATCAKQFGQKQWLESAQHGFDYVRMQHFDPERNAYNWVMQGEQAQDQDNYCYGLAFMLLMHAGALNAGLADAKQGLEATYDLLEQRFWQPEFGLYADEASADWHTYSDYRGQNANMHACEAMIAAYEATQEQKYLDRALLIAENICIRQTQATQGLIWEHYSKNWQVDWNYNKDDPKNLYRPWGFQPGHLTEWTKLLLLIYRHSAQPWLLSRAEDLFNAAWTTAWDKDRGGLYYGFDPEGNICDDDKYFWVQAESMAAAALLAKATNKEVYWQCYDQLWDYSWRHFCEQKHQPWWRLLDANNQVLDPTIASPGAKIDYHTIGACLEILRVLTTD